MSHNQIIKVVLLGDSGVGKSSIALRFATNEFKPYCEATIGASFMSKIYSFSEDDEANNTKDGDQVAIKRHRTVDFKIWDTAGQEKYHSLAPMYYRGSRAAILVYDICHAGTFNSLKKWVDELSVNGPEGLVLVVCGNKYDLCDNRKVDSKAAEAYATSVGAIYLETSAREDVNIEKVFLEIGKRVVPDEEFGPLQSPEKKGSLIDLATALASAPKGWFETYC